MAQELRHFGPYRLVRRLGKGGRGEVFLGLWPGPAGFLKKCALKIFFRTAAGSPQFLANARATLALAHPHIAQVFDFGELEKATYLGRDYVGGINLAALLARCQEQQRRLPLDVILVILRGILSALVYAHQKTDAAGHLTPFIHQNLTPTNVLLSFRGEVKVTDFGTALLHPAVDSSDPAWLQAKYRYASPEQAAGQRLDPRTDVYSAGALLYELLTNTSLLPELDLPQLQRQAQQPSLTLPTRRASWIPVEVEAILRKSLAPSREQRLANAAEMLTALHYFGQRASAAELRGLISPDLLRVTAGRPPLSGLDAFGRRLLRHYLHHLFLQEFERETREEEALQAYLQASSLQHQPSLSPLPRRHEAPPHPASAASSLLAKSKQLVGQLLEVESRHPSRRPQRSWWHFSQWLLLPLAAAIVVAVYEQRDRRTPEEKIADARAKSAVAKPPVAALPPSPLPVAPAQAAPLPLTPAKAAQRERLEKEKRRLKWAMENKGVGVEDDAPLAACMQEAALIEQSGKWISAWAQLRGCRQRLRAIAIDAVWIERKAQRLRQLPDSPRLLPSEKTTVINRALHYAAKEQYDRANQTLNELLLKLAPPVP